MLWESGSLPFISNNLYVIHYYKTSPGLVYKYLMYSHPKRSEHGTYFLWLFAGVHEAVDT